MSFSCFFVCKAKCHFLFHLSLNESELDSRAEPTDKERHVKKCLSFCGRVKLSTRCLLEIFSIVTSRTEICLFSPILLNLYSEFLTKEVLEGFGDFKIVGQVIRTVKYAHDIVLLAEEETVLRGVINRLILVGRYYEMELKVEKTKVMKSRDTHPQYRLWETKKLEIVEYLKYLGNMVTNDARCTREIKSRIAMATQHSTRSFFFTSKVDLNLRKKLVKCYIWSIALYCAEFGQFGK